MTKREKIILIIMLFTIVWGYYMLFYNSGQVPSSKMAIADASVREKKMIKDLASKVMEQKTNKIEKHLFKLAGDSWTKDPFLSPAKGLHPQKKNTENKTVENSAANVAKWIYSGYLEAGGTRLAIINGLEYEEGESLFPLGYYLLSVTKNHVIIGMVGKKKTITLPLTEPY